MEEREIIKTVGNSLTPNTLCKIEIVEFQFDFRIKRILLQLLTVVVLTLTIYKTTMNIYKLGTLQNKTK